MKVGLLTTWQTRCGIAAYTADLVEGLRQQDDITVEVVPITPGAQTRDHYAEQARILNACDVIHIQHEYSFWGTYIPGGNRFHTLRRMLKRPVVLTAHTTTPITEILQMPVIPREGPAGAKLRAMYRLVRMRVSLPVLMGTGIYRRWIEVTPFASASQVIVHTDAARDTLLRRGIASERLHVLPPGIPAPRPAPTGGRAFRERFGLGDDPIITVFGYINPLKGYEVVLDALPSLPPNVRFVIAGGTRVPAEQEYVESLRGDIAARGLESRVVQTGFLDDDAVAEAMMASDLVLVPHTQATGSYSIMVPLAYGKAIVASDQACFIEIADQGRCASIVPTGDAAALAREVGRLLANEEARNALSEQARRYAAERSWTAVARRTVEVYRAALGEAGKPSASAA